MRFQFGRFFKLQQLSSSRVHIKVRDGEFHLIGAGAWYSYWRDPYHLMLTIPWFGFLSIFVLFYIHRTILSAIVDLLILFIIRRKGIGI